MDFFSSIRRFWAKNEIKALYRQISQDTALQMKPLNDISLFIVSAAQNGAKTLNADCPLIDPKKKQDAEIFVLYEFLYFYSHLILRAAFNELPARKIQRLQRYLGPLLSEVGVDAFFAHWDDERKTKMRIEFYENLNSAENEYANCKRFIGESAMDEEALISRLAFNLSEPSGRTFDESLVIRVNEIVIEAHEQRDIKAIINAAGDVLEKDWL